MAGWDGTMPQPLCTWPLPSNLILQLLPGTPPMMALGNRKGGEPLSPRGSWDSAARAAQVGLSAPTTRPVLQAASGGRDAVGRHAIHPARCGVQLCSYLPHPWHGSKVRWWGHGEAAQTVAVTTMLQPLHARPAVQSHLPASTPGAQGLGQMLTTQGPRKPMLPSGRSPCSPRDLGKLLWWIMPQCPP